MGTWKPAATDSSRVPGDSRRSVLAHPPAKIMGFYNILSYFIIFYSIFHHFTEKSIKSTFWPGFLPLQGTPTGENNGWGIILYNMALYCTIWYHIVQYGIILYNMVSYCTIWYHIVQYGIILYNMVSYCTIWHHIVQYGIILYNMVSYCTIWYHIVQYGTILYNMVSYCTIWYHIVQYYIILYYIIARHGF